MRDRLDRRFVRGAARIAVLALIVALGGGTAAAEIIDRMLAVVDGEVVTLSDLERSRRLAALFGDTVPQEESALLQQVIEDRLIGEQVIQFPDLQVSETEVDSALGQLGDTGELSEDTLREAVRQRLLRSRYFELRFRQFIQASEEEVADYYRNVFVPEARARGLETVPELEEVRDRVAENVVLEKTEREISVWIESLFRRSEIEVVH